jgi:hypothetical protein
MKKKPIGKRVKIRLNKDNFDESFVHLDGHPIYGVDKLELIASSDWTKPPRLVLTLNPEIVEIEGSADVEVTYSLKTDRFSNPDIEDE